jgi:hypothetical protein
MNTASIQPRFVHIDSFTMSRTPTSETLVVEGIDDHGDRAVFIASVHIVDVPNDECPTCDHCGHCACRCSCE